MNPSDPRDRQHPSPHIPERSALTGPSVPTRGNSTAINSAAANLVRSQLDNIYSGKTTTPTPQTTPVPQPAQQKSDQKQPQQENLEAANPYERTHGVARHIQPDQWKQYHSAWQEYYQKYYERYYVGQVYKARRVLEDKAKEAAAQAPTVTAQQPAAPVTEPEEPETLSRDEALYDLRKKLRSAIRTNAKKARGSRHFVPIASALGVVMVFLFLQYNQVIMGNVQAYISPAGVDPANIIVNPSANMAISPADDNKLIIPKINVDVPAIWNTTPDHDSQMEAMERGVAWFGISGANSKPGQVGNTVLSGHSSNDITDGGNYKFIFARLDHLEKGDSIFINYNQKRYTYTVTKKEVVKPTEVDALVYDTDKPVLTLITCTPLGTSLNRLLVTAEQVSPDPTSTAEPAPAGSGDSTGEAAMPGNSPTIFERLFGQQ